MPSQSANPSHGETVSGDGMGAADAATKKYLADPARFADAFNYAIYDGEQVVKPDELSPLDSTLTVSGGKRRKAVERRRDGLMAWQAMQDEQATYALLGIERQTYVDGAMPVRCMLYDAMGYTDQIDELKKKNRANGNLAHAEWLSGMQASDRLKPVVTLVVHFGSEPWDVPTSLREMLQPADGRMLSFVPDYQANIVSPSSMCDDDLAKFRTELGLVFGTLNMQGIRTNSWDS